MIISSAHSIRKRSIQKRFLEFILKYIQNVITLFQESEEEEYDAAEYPQRVGRQKHLLDIDIQFNDTRRPGGGRGRGQRSAPRGNRGGNRGGGTGGSTGGGTAGATGGGGDRRESARDGGERTERRFRAVEDPVSFIHFMTVIIYVSH